jgi:simple sugar transport system ATP-binding protein/ribose transport system ATP-binding protein
MATLTAPGTTAPLIELTGIGKRFGGVHALNDVSIRITPGTIHAIVGENGAGKSTLGKVLSGSLRPDQGEVRLNGEVHRFRSPRDALNAGIATIAQEIALVPGLTVDQNVFLGIEAQRGGIVRRQVMRRQTRVLCREAGFDLPPNQVVSRLRLPDQQKTEILRAIAREASTIVMDEPTAALSRIDAEKLHVVIRKLRDSGRTVVLISHFLDEVLALADNVTVLRDGVHVRTAPSASETEQSLIEAMLGRSMQQLYPEVRYPAEDSPVVLDVDNLSAPGVRNISLRVRAGEIVGLAGLVGAGRSELALAIYGAVRKHGGEAFIGTRRATIKSPRQARRAGLFLVPESRKEQGLVAGRSVRENVNLAHVAQHATLGLLRGRAEKRATARVLAQTDVRADSLELPIKNLSGGNQQKVMFARGMLCKPQVLLADEPTRGVDIGSRQSIYGLLKAQAESGVGVVIISSDLEEVLGLAHRIVVIRGGSVAAELSGAEMTPANVLSAALLGTTAKDARG